VLKKPPAHHRGFFICPIFSDFVYCELRLFTYSSLDAFFVILIKPKINLMKTIYSFVILLALSCSFSLKAQLTAVLNPVQDAYFLSFGGGQGGNPMLKFDISSIPPGATIVKATLKVYVWDTTNATSGFGSPVCGNMIFRNLNNKQSWVESDSAFKFDPNSNMYSDSVIMVAGFGDSIGWATSSDLKSIVIKDHMLSNTYCTISMKDPDDMTCCGAVGPNFSQFLGDQVDSMITGNKTVGVDEMIFYPRESPNPNLRPYLTIEYTCMVANSQTVAVCAGGSLVVGASTYTATGIYSDTLTAMNGCDSIVNTDLTVKAALNLTVSAAGNSLTSNENGATYQWIDCNNGNLPMGGETSQTFNAQASGDYAVIVTENGCSDTSACNNVVFTGMSKEHTSYVRTYPNPVKDMLTVEMEKSNNELTLYDISGRVIYHTLASQKAQLDMKQEGKGLYILKIVNTTGIQVIKIVKD